MSRKMFWVIQQKEANDKETELMCGNCGYIRAEHFSYGYTPEEMASKLLLGDLYPYCERCGANMHQDSVYVVYNDGRKYYVLIGGTEK